MESHPQQLGKYQLDELIAVGGMAEIYRARTAGLGGVEKMLAVKRLHPHYCSDRDFVEMLVDEARIAMQLNHKNIGQVYNLERSGEWWFLAMEYVHGRDLFRVIRRFIAHNQLMPLECACYIAAEICSGLSYAHRRCDSDGHPLNIIHRDVSPQNVIVSFEGEVKIVDFGIAKAARRASFTQNGVIKGKFYYMSPEQARGDRIDQRTDIFSVGAILYEMVTGRMLYEGEDDARLVHRARRAEYQPPSVYSPDIPGELEQIILKALSRDIHQRFATARDMQLALSNFSHAMGWNYDSVMLSDQMHGLFDAATGPSDMQQAVGPGAYGHADAGWGPAPHHDHGNGHAHDPAAHGAWNGHDQAAYARPSQVDEDAPTHVYGDELGRIVDEIDAHYDAHRAGHAAAGGALQRAAAPMAHEVDLQLDQGRRREDTVVGARVPQPPVRPRQGPPRALIAVGVAGIVLLVGAFVFAATQLLSADEPEAETPRLAESSSAASGTFTVESDPPGARIFIDGKDTGLFTPANLSGVSLGSHEVTLKLRHHDDLAQTVDVTSGGTWQGTLEARKGILRIETTPPGAEIHVDGKRIGTAPINLDDQSMGAPHTVAASLDGHKDILRTVQWVSDERILDVTLTLVPAELRFGNALAALVDGAGATVAGTFALTATAPAADTTPADTPPAEPRPRVDRPRKSDRDDRRRDDSGSKGKISVAAKPPGVVYVDGKSTGKKTPVRGLNVKSGYRKIKVKFADGTFSGEKRALIKPSAELKLLFRQ